MTIQQNINYTRTRILAEKVLDKASEADVSNDDDVLAYALNSAGLKASIIKGEKITVENLPCISLDNAGFFTRIDDNESLNEFKENYDMADKYIIINF